MVMDETKPKTDDINCPFLKRVKPATDKGFLQFVSDVSNGGLQYILAFLITMDVVSKQKGLFAALTGDVPDLYALNQVDGVSHPDKYNRYKDATKERLEKAANEQGLVKIQDLVDIKKWIASEEKLETILPASEAETRILFIGSGGNLETGEVFKDDVLTFLDGNKPEHTAVVTTDAIKKARAMCNWEYSGPAKE